MESNALVISIPADEVLSVSNAKHTEYLATDLANFIKAKKLYNDIQGKQFVNVEGWQYAGTRLGFIPLADTPVNLSTEGEIKYGCNVRLMDVRNGQIVGSGYAVCSNKEKTKKYYEEYAIASMSQTRAVGKAYRNLLAWIIRAAGYQPTPAEEMDQVKEEEEEKLRDMLSTYYGHCLTLVIEKIRACKSREELKAIWEKYNFLKNDQSFADAIKEVSANFPKPEKR